MCAGDRTVAARASRRGPTPTRECPEPRRRCHLMGVTGLFGRLQEVPMQVSTTGQPGLEFVVTATLIVDDVERSTAFYRDVLGAEVLRVGQPTFLRLGNIWLIINVGGGGTDDKPDV